MLIAANSVRPAIGGIGDLVTGKPTLSIQNRENLLHLGGLRNLFCIIVYGVRRAFSYKALPHNVEPISFKDLPRIGSVLIQLNDASFPGLAALPSYSGCALCRAAYRLSPQYWQVIYGANDD